MFPYVTYIYPQFAQAGLGPNHRAQRAIQGTGSASNSTSPGITQAASHLAQRSDVASAGCVLHWVGFHGFYHQI